jgi:acetyltransferase-like isoleucine patch superfamily enzyme
MSTPLLVVVRRLARYYSRSLRCWYFNTVWGMDIGENCIISYKARLDKSYPRGIHIGRDSAVTFGAAVLTHDYLNDVHVDTWIGERCLVGAHAIVFPGVHIGDGSIVAAGSVVMKDIPPGCLAAGNPARVYETGIVVGPYGRILQRKRDPSVNAVAVKEKA